jgi:hypothetical protein
MPRAALQQIGLVPSSWKAALAATGLSSTRIELHTALAALIRNPALIERWRSGRALLKE